MFLALARGVAQFVQVLDGGLAFLVQQVVDPAGALADERQGIVDLVGHAGGHFAKGRHLAGLDHLRVNVGLVAVKLLKVAHNGPGNGQRPENHDHRAAQHKEQHIQTQLLQGSQRLPGVFQQHQPPRHHGDGRDGGQILHLVRCVVHTHRHRAKGILAVQGVGGPGWFGQLEGEGVHDIAMEA